MSREGPRVLFCAFAEVPGPSAAATRTAQVVRAFGAGFDVDVLCLKGPEVAHIERRGAARMMRVPVDDRPYAEKLATYRRALGRQLAGDPYDLVWCADLFSAAVAAAYKAGQGFSLVIDAGPAPSEVFARLLPVDAEDKKLKAEWAAAEAGALSAADVVVTPSRTAARVWTSRVDPRRVQVLARAVDREVFAPPSFEVSLDGGKRVVVLGGREGGPLLEPAADILKALSERLGGDTARLALLGSPPEDGAGVQAALTSRGLAERVELLDASGPEALAALLESAHVVVVPSAAERDVEVQAVPHRALEAMACRRPTVLTGPAAAFQDTLVAGEDALVVPAGAPDEVAAAVAKLLDSPALREAIAQSGARRVEQEADLATRLKQVAGMLTDVLGVALGGRGGEATDPADAFEPSASSTQPPPPSTLPPPPVDDVTESGRHLVSEVVVKQAPRRRAPEGAQPSVADSFAPVPTTNHEQAPLGASSGVFTDESTPLQAPRAPEAPQAADLGESSMESSLEAAEDLADLPELPGDKTVIAPPPEGLEDFLAAHEDDGAERPRTGDGVDEWYGDTRIDDGARFVATPTPIDASVDPGASQAKSPPAVRVFAVDAVSLPDGDPWTHDTIADARPVFTSDEIARRTSGQERAPSVSEKTHGKGNFLVDPEVVERGPLDDATMDDMHLPRETPSSEG